jgi:hypothetical protein
VVAVVNVRTAGRLLGDQRRGRRLGQLVEALAASCAAHLPTALTGWCGVKAAYRFFANPAVTPEAILASARPGLLERVAGQTTVLLLQDTTTLDFTTHPATRGVGPIGTRRQGHWGLLLHSCLAATPDGVPLGLAAQESWARDPATTGQARLRRTRAAEQKESARWARVEAASRAVLPAGVRTVTIADREADLYTLFAAPRPATAQLLLRVAQTQRRVLADADALTPHALADAVAAAPVVGRYSVALRAEPGRPARTALCTVRVGSVTLCPPQNQRAGVRQTERVPLVALLAVEESPAAGQPPLHWLLLTTLPVPDFAAAAELLVWYSLRWLIERFHFVLKSGCRVEELQLQQGDRLRRAVAVCSLVALTVLGLTYLARDAPELPCTVALSTAEWQTLWRYRFPRQPLPTVPPPLGAVALQVAQLGGFLGRAGDGDPGPLTLWRGLTRLHDLTAGALLAQPPPLLQDVGNA